MRPVILVRTIMDEQYPHWTRHVEWLSAHKGQIVQLHCSRCRMTKAYKVDDALQQQGDVSVRSFPILVARLLGCSRVDRFGEWQGCGMTYFPTRAFTDPPKPKPPEQIRLPIGTYRLEEMPLAAIPEYYEVLGYCPCGWRRQIEVRKLAKARPDLTTTAVNKLLTCRRCRNRTGNFLAFRYAPR